MCAGVVPSPRVVVLGATAAMVGETLRLFAASGARLVLAARDSERCEALADELRSRGASEAHVLAFEASEPGAATAAIADAEQRLGAIDYLLVAHGERTDQLRSERDPAVLKRSLAINGTSVIDAVFAAARSMEAHGGRCIAAISSGAGVRGRRCTYTYGMSKSLVTTCLEGVRARLHPAGVRVLTVLPAFVDSPMTADLPRSMRFVSADSAGARIHHAMTRGRRDTLHIPRMWRLALLATRLTPEVWLKRSRSEERLARRIGIWPGEHHP